MWSVVETLPLTPAYKWCGLLYKWCGLLYKWCGLPLTPAHGGFPPAVPRNQHASCMAPRHGGFFSPLRRAITPFASPYHASATSPGSDSARRRACNGPTLQRPADVHGSAKKIILWPLERGTPSARIPWKFLRNTRFSGALNSLSQMASSTAGLLTGIQVGGTTTMRGFCISGVGFCISGVGYHYDERPSFMSWQLHAWQLHAWVYAQRWYRCECWPSWCCEV